MEVNKTLAQLEKEAKDFNIEVLPSGKNGRFLKKDYVKQLQLFNLTKIYGTFEQVPVNLKFRLTFESPQLVYNYFDLKKPEQENIWESEDVWLVEKVRGVRGTLIHSKHEHYSCFSRELNESNYLWTDYASRMVDSTVINLGENLVVDVEIELGNQDVKETVKALNYETNSDYQVISVLLMMSDEQFKIVSHQHKNIFKYKLIDVYHIDGVDIRKLPYSEREVHFESAIVTLKKAGFSISRPLFCKEPTLKKAFHEGLIKEGYEGSVAVFVDKPCVLDGTRGRDEMVKIKRSIFSLLFDKNALTDTVDGFITEIVSVDEITGLVNEIKVSAFTQLGEEKVIAVTGAIPLSMRMFSYGDNSCHLAVGQVVELSGTKWHNGMIQEAVVERLRWDKSASECILSV